MEESDADITVREGRSERSHVLDLEASQPKGERLDPSHVSFLSLQLFRKMR